MSVGIEGPGGTMVLADPRAMQARPRARRICRRLPVIGEARASGCVSVEVDRGARRVQRPFGFI